VDQTAGLDVLGGKKNLLPVPGIEAQIIQYRSSCNGAQLNKGEIYLFLFVLAI